MNQGAHAQRGRVTARARAHAPARGRRWTRSLSSGLWPSALASHQVCWPRRRRGGCRALAGSRGRRSVDRAPDTAGGDFHPAL